MFVCASAYIFVCSCFNLCECLCVSVNLSVLYIDCQHCASESATLAALSINLSFVFHVAVCVSFLYWSDRQSITTATSSMWLS